MKAAFSPNWKVTFEAVDDFPELEVRFAIRDHFDEMRELGVAKAK